MIEECINPDDFEEMEVEVCPRCKRNEKESLHICPFKQDMYNDTETLCNCCTRCERECAMDI